MAWVDSTAGTWLLAGSAFQTSGLIAAIGVGLWRSGKLEGLLKVAELTCPVALYTAASTSERIAFHTLNRATGHRVRRQFVDQETGKPVESDEQVKGYEVGEGEYVALEPDEIAAAVPESDKTLAVAAFIRCDDIDTVYFDRPYYLTRATGLPRRLCTDP